MEQREPIDSFFQHTGGYENGRAPWFFFAPQRLFPLSGGVPPREHAAEEPQRPRMPKKTPSVTGRGTLRSPSGNSGQPKNTCLVLREKFGPASKNERLQAEMEPLRKSRVPQSIPSHKPTEEEHRHVEVGIKLCSISFEPHEQAHS